MSSKSSKKTSQTEKTKGSSQKLRSQRQICKCCQKSASSQGLCCAAPQVYECLRCNQSVCQKCQKNGECYVCRIKSNPNTNSEAALQKLKKNHLMIILTKLHFNKSDMNNASKDEMIVQILKRCKISILDDDSDQVPRPRPPQPLPDDQNVPPVIEMHPKPIPTLDDIRKQQATVEKTSAKPNLAGEEKSTKEIQMQQSKTKGSGPIKESLKYDYPKSLAAIPEPNNKEIPLDSTDPHRNRPHHHHHSPKPLKTVQENHDHNQMSRLEEPKQVSQQSYHSPLKETLGTDQDVEAVKKETLGTDQDVEALKLTRDPIPEGNIPIQPVLQYVQIVHKKDEEEVLPVGKEDTIDSNAQILIDNQNDVILSRESPLDSTLLNEVLRDVQAVQEGTIQLPKATEDGLPPGYLETEIDGYYSKESSVDRDEIPESTNNNVDIKFLEEADTNNTSSECLEDPEVEVITRVHSPGSETPVRVLSIKRLTEQELEQSLPLNYHPPVPAEYPSPVEYPRRKESRSSKDDSNSSKDDSSCSESQTSDDETSGFYDVSKAMEQIEEPNNENKGKGDADNHTPESTTTEALEPIILQKSSVPLTAVPFLSNPSIVSELPDQFTQEAPIILMPEKPEKAEIMIVQRPAEVGKSPTQIQDETKTLEEDSGILLRDAYSENDLYHVSYNELRRFLETYGVSTEPGIDKSVLITRASMIWRQNQRNSDRSSNGGGQVSTQNVRTSTGLGIGLEDLKDYENYEMFGYSDVVVESMQPIIEKVSEVLKPEGHSDKKHDPTPSDSDDNEDGEESEASEASGDMVTVDEFLQDLKEMEEKIPDDINLILPSTKPEEDVIAGILLRRSLSRQDSNTVKSPTTPKPESDFERDSDVFVDADTEFRISQSPSSTLEWTHSTMEANNELNSAPVPMQATQDLTTTIMLGNVKEDPDEDDCSDLMEPSRGLSAEIPLRHLQDDGRVYSSGRSSWVAYLESLTENQVNTMEEFKLRAILKSLNINKQDLWKREDLVNAVKKVWNELKKPEPKRNLSETLDDNVPDGVKRHPSSTSLNSLSSIQSLTGITLEDIQNEKEIDALTTRNLRTILEHYGVPVDTLVLRKHFVSEVKKLWGRTKTLEDYGLRVEVTPRPKTSSSSSTSSAQKAKPSKIPVAVTSPSKRASDTPLKSITSEKDIKRMSFQSLKAILQSQGLPVKMEDNKEDLILRTIVLWKSQNLESEPSPKK